MMTTQPTRGDDDYVAPTVVNRIFIDVNNFLWSNPGEVMRYFSIDDVFQLFCNIVQVSIGKPAYELGILYDWVDLMLGYDDSQEMNNEQLWFYDCLSTMFNTFVFQNSGFIHTQLAPNLMRSDCVLAFMKQHGTSVGVIEICTNE